VKWLVLVALAALTACTGQAQIEEAFVKAEVVLPIVSDEVPFEAEIYRTINVSRQEEAEPEPELEIEPEPIFPNEVGEIMVLVYHGLHEESPGPYDRLTADFWNDLQTLYDQGYRLIALADLINNNITTPAGYTPVAITFDDGLPSAFSLKELEDGTLTPVPGTAVYILNAFYEKNPAFGRAASFFINAWRDPFEGAGTLEERFRFLIDNGFEIGNHSFNHLDFSRLNAQQLQQEMGSLNQFIRKHLPDYESLAMAYPFSIRPRAGLRHYALAGEYNGIPYNYVWALRVGNTGSPAVPHHVRFDPLNVSRVVPSDQSTDYRNVPDLGYLLRRFEREPHLRFISDGDPDTITVPSDQVHYVDMYNLGDKELVVYDRYEAYEGEDTLIEPEASYESEVAG